MIIYRLGSLALHILDLVLTVVAWLIFAVLLWGGVLAAGENRGISSSTVEQSGASPLQTILGYVTVGSLLGAVFIAWALYNEHIYSKRERRSSKALINLDELGESFSLDRRDIQTLQWSRRIVLFHDPDGQIIRFQHSGSIAGSEQRLPSTMMAD